MISRGHLSKFPSLKLHLLLKKTLDRIFNETPKLDLPNSASAQSRVRSRQLHVLIPIHLPQRAGWAYRNSPSMKVYAAHIYIYIYIYIYVYIYIYIYI